MFTLQSGAQHAIAFSCKDNGRDASSLSPTLRSMNHDESHLNGGGQVAVCFQQNTRDEVREVGNKVAGALAAQAGMKQQNYIAFREQADALCSTYGTKWNGNASAENGSLFAKTSFGVRRLTPVETCRLQGFPDDHNAWGINDKGERVEMSDSQRYRQMGNAVSVPVAHWIGKRIMEAL